MKCTTCGVKTERGNAALQRPVGEHLFVGDVPASTCPKCGEVYYDGDTLQRFEQLMRRTLGMRAVDLAELLDVAPETLSRWESGARDVDRASWTALAGLVVDRAEGRDRLINILRAIREPKKQPKNIRVDSDKRHVK